MHACLLVFFVYSLAIPTQAFLVNLVWWSHLTKDLATVYCLCLIEIMMVSLSFDFFEEIPSVIQLLCQFGWGLGPYRLRGVPPSFPLSAAPVQLGRLDSL